MEKQPYSGVKGSGSGISAPIVSQLSGVVEIQEEAMKDASASIASGIQVSTASSGRLLFAEGMVKQPSSGVNGSGISALILSQLSGVVEIQEEAMKDASASIATGIHVSTGGSDFKESRIEELMTGEGLKQVAASGIQEEEGAMKDASASIATGIQVYTGGSDSKESRVEVMAGEGLKQVPPLGTQISTAATSVASANMGASASTDQMWKKAAEEKAGGIMERFRELRTIALAVNDECKLRKVFFGQRIQGKVSLLNAYVSDRKALASFPDTEIFGNESRSKKHLSQQALWGDILSRSNRSSAPKGHGIEPLFASEISDGFAVRKACR